MVSFPRYFTVCITYQPPLVINITLDECCLREILSRDTASYTETQYGCNLRLPKLTNISLDFAVLPLNKTGSQIVDRGSGLFTLKIKAV